MTNQVKTIVFGDQLQRQHRTLWSRCSIPVEQQVYSHMLGVLEDDWDDGPHDQTQRMIEQQVLLAWGQHPSGHRFTPR